MNDEEKKAIEVLKEEIKQEEYDVCSFTRWFEVEQAKILLNLIEKQQKNYQSCMDYADSLNRDIGELLLNLEKKDKIINEMAEYISEIDITEIMCPRCKYRNKECTLEECIAETIKYFEKKVEGSNE